MINLVVGGDFCPIGSVDKLLSIGPYYPSDLFCGDIDAISNCDLFVLNLECPLTESNYAIEKVGPNLKSSPAAVSLLKQIGVGLVTLANNHVYDYGQQGLADTLDICREAGVDTVGAAHNIEAAARIYYQEIKGQTVAFINMAEKEFNCAKENRGGANPFEIIATLKSIWEARKNADHVLLILHGGLEHMHYPSPKSVKILRFLAEQGLTAIIRHHPHVVQGHEVWKGVPIFYSLGNFLFDWYTRVKQDAWYEGILVELKIDKNDHCAFDLHPFDQCKEEPGIEMLFGNSRERFIRKFDDWSLAIADEHRLCKEWKSVIDQRKMGYLGRLITPNYLIERLARRLGVLRYFSLLCINRLVLENYLRCDAHREALLDVLEREHME